MRKILNTSKKAIAVVGIVVAATTATLSANAQGNPSGPGTSGSGVKANGQAAGGGAGAPIDGGASLLIVATAAYTSRKLAKMKEAKKKAS